ncbi:MAG: hypothetical protein ACFCU1_11280 [Sumerlaeia bacterium]
MHYDDVPKSDYNGQWYLFVGEFPELVPPGFIVTLPYNHDLDFEGNQSFSKLKMFFQTGSPAGTAYGIKYYFNLYQIDIPFFHQVMGEVITTIALNSSFGTFLIINSRQFNDTENRLLKLIDQFSDYDAKTLYLVMHFAKNRHLNVYNIAEEKLTVLSDSAYF